MEYKYDIFISYSRKDMAVADRICNAFKQQGITYFIDRQGITGGMEFPALLAKAIKESRMFLFLASENSYASKFTQSEIIFQQEAERRNHSLYHRWQHLARGIGVYFLCHQLAKPETASY